MFTSSRWLERLKIDAIGRPARKAVRKSIASVVALFLRQYDAQFVHELQWTLKRAGRTLKVPGDLLRRRSRFVTQLAQKKSPRYQLLFGGECHRSGAVAPKYRKGPSIRLEELCQPQSRIVGEFSPQDFGS
ncbi:MAG: hypothetical protein AB1898_11355 [Acidobacteriota bacterium]